MESIKKRKEAAKAYRKVVPRKDLGIWKVQPERPEIEQLLLMQEKTRLKELIPIRRERMAASPFSFFRGATLIQAHDLSITPGTGFRVQACGDAHISNFGIFGMRLGAFPCSRKNRRQTRDSRLPRKLRGF